MKSILRTAVCASALAFTMLAPPALAQGQPAEPDDPTTPDEQSDQSAPPGGGLNDIVVTAERRSETAQRTGLALDVVSGEELINAGVLTPSTLNSTVPSLFISRGGGVNTSYFIRGVGNFTQNGYSDPAIAFNVDGVYYGRPGSTVGTFYDLERIEVLKGPQGTLYGRNATGGAINIITARARPGEFSGYVTGAYGNFDAIDVEGAVNIPIGSNGALRFSGKIVDREGFNTDGTFDEVGQGFRAQLFVELTPELNIRVVGDYAQNSGLGPGGSYEGAINTTPGTAATATSPANYTIVPSGLDPFSGLLSPGGRDFFARRVLGGPRINPGPLNTPSQDNQFIGVSAEVNWETSFGTFTLIPAFRDSQINTLFNGPSFRGALVDEQDEQFSVELRLAGNRIGPIDWLIGGFYFDESVKGRSVFSQYTVQSFQDYSNQTTSAAVFGRLTFNLTDQLRLIGAARYTDDRKTFVGDGRNVIQICTNPMGCIGGPSVPLAPTFADLARLITLPTLPGPANSVAFGTVGNRLFFVPVPINGALDRDRVTYRVAGEWDIAERSLLYASFETGYRSGGFNFTLGRATYEPEFIEAITLGVKNRFLDNRLQVNVEAFDWRYTDQQVAHFGSDATNNNSFFTENIGRSRIRGVDLDVQFRATPTTLLRGSVQYLDNVLTQFTYNTIRNTTTNAVPPPVGCATSPGRAPLPGSTTLADVWVVDCSGNPGFNSPEWSVNVGAEQIVPIGEYELTLNVDGRYRSNRVTSFDYLPFQNSGETFTADAALRFGPADGQWSIGAFVQNLTDEIYSTLAQFAGTTGNVIVTNYAPPRTFGARASFAF